MKLLVLLCTVSYHYCYGYPIVGGESTEEVQIGDWDDAFLKNMLDTMNDTYSKDYFNQLLSNAEEMESLVKDINQQDIDTNEIRNLDSELGDINDNEVVVVHIKYDVDSGTIAIDSIKVDDAPEVTTAWGRWPWFFLALGVALLMKLVWYLCRKEQQYKRDNEWRIQLVSEK